MKLGDKKGKMARKMHFKKDEEKGIKEYKEAIHESKGTERKTYKKILQKHLSKIKKI